LTISGREAYIHREIARADLHPKTQSPIRNAFHKRMAAMTEELSADEIALYDRQLRLWGIEAQNRMRKAHVLLITIRALGNEIAKNLVLAGIGSLTIMDSNVVTETDVESQFFITGEDIGKNVPSLFKLTHLEAC
jgi:ubiquitin-like 1-activating enzyme E1 A